MTINADTLKPLNGRAPKLLACGAILRIPIVCVSVLLLMMVLLSGCGRKKNRAAVPVSTRPPLASVPGAWEEGIASWYGDPYHGRRTANGEIYDQEKMTAAHPSLRFNTTVEVTNLSNGLRTRVRINDRGPFVKNRAIDLSRAAARQIEMLGPGTAPVRVEVITVAGMAPTVVPASSVPVPVPAPVDDRRSMDEPGSVKTVPSALASTTTASIPAAEVPGLPGDESNSDHNASSTGTPPLQSGYAIQMGAFAAYENAVRLRDSLLNRVPVVRIVAGDDPANPTRVLWRVLVGERLSKLAADELFSSLRVDFPRIILVSDH